MNAYETKISETRTEERIAMLALELKDIAQKLQMSVHLDSCFSGGRATVEVHLFPDTGDLLTISIKEGGEMLGAIEKARQTGTTSES